MERIYEKMLLEHGTAYRQMAFLAGPRQVGKITAAQRAAGNAKQSLYLNWDVQEHRRILLAGPEAVAAACGFDTLAERADTIIFDEIHKYSKRKTLLKGFFDLYGETCGIIVTGSGRLCDWSLVQDQGARNENFIAGHLLKAVQWWTDTGLGSYQLYFIRDKEKREVDFLVTRDEQPWMLVVVKTSGKANLSPHLSVFQEKTGAEHALQVAMDADYVDADCFTVRRPVIVPAKTFLSQLV